MRRRIAAGALALAVAMPVTGCATLTSNTSTPAGGSPSASPVNQAAVLATAVAKTTGINLKLVLAGDTAAQNVTAIYDASHQTALLTSGDQLRFVVTAAEMYLSGSPDLKGKTLRLRLAKLHTDSQLSLFADVLFALHALGTATQVDATSPNTFSGKVDLTKMAAASLGTRKFVDFVSKVGGDKIRALGFNATVNATGYLAQFQVTLPGVDNGKDSDYRVDLSAFGQPVSVKVPTGRNVIEAPAAAYEN